MTTSKSAIQLKHSSCFLEHLEKDLWKLTLRFVLPKYIIPRSELQVTLNDNSKLRFDQRETPVLDDLPQFNVVVSVSPSAQGTQSKILSTDVTDQKVTFKLPASANPLPGILHRRILSFSATTYWLTKVPTQSLCIGVALKKPFTSKPYTSDVTVAFDVEYYRTCPEIPPVGRFLFASTGERVRPLVLPHDNALIEVLSSICHSRSGMWGVADISESSFWKSNKGAEYVARQIAFQMKAQATIDTKYSEKRLVIVEIDNQQNDNERLFWREMTCHCIAGIEVYSQPKEFTQNYFGVSGDRLALENIGMDDKGRTKWAFHFETDKIRSMTKQYKDLVQSENYRIVPWVKFISGFSEIWKPKDSLYIELRVELIKNLAQKILKEWNSN